MYEVKSEAFSGPMEKLLSLIEERQLEITRVSLAQVTGDFIAYVESLDGDVHSGYLSDFVVIASRLLVIKSKVLLPSLTLTKEEEGDIADLEHRLVIYREFSSKGTSASGGKNAAAHLLDLWKQNRISFAKPFLSVLGQQEFFYPPKDLDRDDLHQSFESLARVLSGLVVETKTVKQNVVTLQEKIHELTQRLSNMTHVTVKGRASAAEKQEVIVMFLAVLHMLSGRLADATQEGMFGDIIIKKQDAQHPQT
jgi:segregation and condensation protein A